MARILIVEDEPAIADTIVYALERDCHEVACAGTAADGLALFGAGSWDCLVLDVGLPDASGFDVCRTVRQQSTVPVLFLTARDDEVDRVVGLELGADDYIAKPFSPRELAARVQANLRRWQGAFAASTANAAVSDAHRVQVGPFVVDQRRHVLTYYSEAVALSAQQFRLLAALLADPGRVFTRRELMREAWDDPDMSLSRAVDSHIRDIRAKLRLIADEGDVIRTHRGAGYSLEVTD